MLWITTFITFHHPSVQSWHRWSWFMPPFPAFSLRLLDQLRADYMNRACYTILWYSPSSFFLLQFLFSLSTLKSVTVSIGRFSAEFSSALSIHLCNLGYDEVQGRALLLWGLLWDPGTGCQARWWMPYFWKHSRTGWMVLWETLSNETYPTSWEG